MWRSTNLASVALCRDPEGRYQTTAELVADLNKLDGEGKPLPRVWRFTPRYVMDELPHVFLGLTE